MGAVLSIAIGIHFLSLYRIMQSVFNAVLLESNIIPSMKNVLILSAIMYSYICYFQLTLHYHWSDLRCSSGSQAQTSSTATHVLPERPQGHHWKTAPSGVWRESTVWCLWPLEGAGCSQNTWTGYLVQRRSSGCILTGLSERNICRDCFKCEIYK